MYEVIYIVLNISYQLELTQCEVGIIALLLTVQK